MTLVKELNELAERMTGTNPKATTDAQVMNYIEQNYSSGAGVYDFEMGLDFFERYSQSATTREAITITNEEDLQLLTNISEVLNQNQNAIIKVKIMGTLNVYPIINYASDLEKVVAMQSQVFLGDRLMVVDISMNNNSYGVKISYYDLSSLL